MMALFAGPVMPKLAGTMCLGGGHGSVAVWPCVCAGMPVVRASLGFSGGTPVHSSPLGSLCVGAGVREL